MKKKIIATILSVIVVISITSCGKTSGNSGIGGLKNAEGADKAGDNEASILVTGEDYPLVVRDYLKHEIKIDEKPERVAVLAGTQLNIWYDLGGESICTSDVSENLRIIEGCEEKIKNLPQVGAVYAVDMEEVVSQEPDLIISQVGTQSTPASKLSDMGYNVIQTRIKGFDGVLDTYRAFGTLLGKSELAEQRVSELEAGKKEITDKLPDDDIKIVILYVTSKSLAVKLDNSIAGDITNILKLDNIASDLPADTIGSETTPLDIEYIVEKDPDYVFVTTMISSNEKARETVEEQFSTNPAWQAVRAVNEGKVIYLPQQYYLYNAGPYYVDAIKYMAQSIYPEIYGEVK